MAVGDPGSGGGGVTSLGYDANGNLTDDGERVMEYDALNRLSVVRRKDTAVTIAEYEYDALGRRAVKRVSGGGLSGDIPSATIDYYHAGMRCFEERIDDNPVRQYVWGRYVDELVQQKDFDGGTSDHYLLCDEQYRSFALTDDAGAVVEAYDVDAYGNAVTYTAGVGGDFFAANGATTNNPVCEHRYTGQRLDPETGLYYYRARYYNPRLGRFLSRDPKNYADGMNLYQYVGGGPMEGVDPEGTDWVWPWDPEASWKVSDTLGLWGGGIRSTVSTAAARGEQWAVNRGNPAHAAAAGFYANQLEIVGNILGGAVDLPGTVAGGIEAYQGVISDTGEVMARTQLAGGSEALTYFEGGGYMLNRLMGTAAITEGAVNLDIASATEVGGLYERALRINAGVGQTAGNLAGAAGLYRGGVFATDFAAGSIRVQGLVPQGGRGARLLSEYRRHQQQGFTPREARYLTEPYPGRGHHFIPRRSPLPDSIVEHRLNLMGRGMSRGRFYERHYLADWHFNYAPFPRAIGGGWHGGRIGLSKAPQGYHGFPIRLWYGAPDWLRYSAIGAGGGAAAGAGGYYYFTDDK